MEQRNSFCRLEVSTVVGAPRELRETQCRRHNDQEAFHMGPVARPRPEVTQRHYGKLSPALSYRLYHFQDQDDRSSNKHRFADFRFAN